MVRKYNKQDNVFECMVYSADGKTPLCSFTADFRIRLSLSSVNYGTNAWTLIAEFQRFVSRLQRYLFDTEQFKINDGRLYGQEDFLFTDEMFLDDNYLA